MKNNLQKLIEMIVKQELEEINAGGTLGSMEGPLGMDLEPIHKAFWSGDKKEKKKKFKYNPIASGELKENIDLNSLNVMKIDFGHFVINHPLKDSPTRKPHSFPGIDDITEFDNVDIDFFSGLSNFIGNETDYILIDAIEIGHKYQHPTGKPIPKSRKYEIPLNVIKIKFYPPNKIELVKFNSKPSLQLMILLQNVIPQLYQTYVAKEIESKKPATSENKNVLDKMGYQATPDVRGKNTTVYITKGDTKSKDDLKLVSKNLNKKAMSLSDPPSMGISLPKKD